MSIQINILEIIGSRVQLTNEISLGDLSLDENEDLLLSKKIKQLREEYAVVFFEKEIKKPVKCEKIMEIFFRLWEFLNMVSPSHALYIPPIYSTQKLREVYLYFINNYLLREEGKDMDSGNMVLGGIEGTGKTTVAKSMLLAVNLLSVRYILLFFDYKYSEKALSKLPSIDELLVEFSIRWKHSNFREPFGVLEEKEGKSMRECVASMWQNGMGIGIGLIADEIQELYAYGSENAKFELLRRIETFGKKIPRAFLVLTGSSSDLHYALFQKGKDEKGKIMVGFNRSLCTFFHIEALRDIISLDNYVQRRYGKALSRSELQQVLYSTGGIGRRIHELLSSKITFTPIDQETETLANELYFKSNSMLFLIIALIKMKHPQPIEDLVSFWNSDTLEALVFESTFGIDYKDTHVIIAGLGIQNFDFMIYRLVDSGMLYLNQNKRIEISIPSILKAFHNEIAGEDLFRYAVSLAMIFTHEDVNSGKTFEKFLLPRLCKISGAIFYEYGKAGITIENKHIYIEHTDQERILLKSIHDFHLLDKKLFFWNKEIGVDGVQFTYNELNQILKIDFWQSKGGYHKNSIGGGEIETYVSTYLEDGSVKNIKDNYCGGILVKGFVGISTLLSAFLAICSPNNLQLGNFVLTTTKDAFNARKKYHNKLVRISEKILEDFQLQNILKGSEVKVIIFDRTKWFRAILEENMLMIMPANTEDEQIDKQDDDVIIPRSRTCVIS